MIAHTNCDNQEASEGFSTTGVSYKKKKKKHHFLKNVRLPTQTK